ncbi:MAG: class I SAM-dependent methyltransferase [Steroidobacteraceae bacterium]
MNQSEFDQFADEYTRQHSRNVRLSGETPDYFAEYKVRDISRHLGSRSTLALDVLDFGAGVCSSLPWFRKHLPDCRITCLDVSVRSLEIGAMRFPDAASFVSFDGRNIPVADRSFDVVLAACVFHHIPAKEHAPLLEQIRRVLRPSGVFALFEHNPFNPLTVHAVNTCEFDANAVLIRATEMRDRIRRAGFETARITYRMFFPRVLSIFRPIEPLLGWCPVGAQYSIFAN